MEKEILKMPLWQLSVSEFLEIQKRAFSEQGVEKQDAPKATKKNYVYGLRGIRDLFHVSHATAQRLKDGVLSPAVRQLGRKIIVDADFAMELFNQQNNEEYRYGSTRKNKS